MDSYDACPEIKTYLEDVRADIVENVDDFLPAGNHLTKHRP